MAYTTDDIINWAKISQSLAAIKERKRTAATGATIDTDLHIKLYVEGKTVEWYNEQETVDEDTLYLISNWLWALCGPYGLEAQYIYGGSGGQIAPINPSVVLPEPYYFYVTGASFIPTGDSTKTFPGSWAGYNMVFSRGGIVQSEVATEPSYFTWNPATKEFFCSPAAVAGELFAIIPT
jgi:hypothetical protein